MIRHLSLAHGWYYHYRVHNFKLNALCNGDFSPMRSFLELMFEDRPDGYFTSGPRSSALKFDLDIPVTRVENHEVCKLAELGLMEKRYKTAHSNVQMFMLENDFSTLAVEAPIWLEPSELPGFSAIFDSEEPLTGHVDALRVEDGKVWIWDYKPGAEKEKYATTQTYFYALMMSKRTGIPLNNFMCGYFDEKEAFVFEPSLKFLENI